MTKKLFFGHGLVYRNFHFIICIVIYYLNSFIYILLIFLLLFLSPDNANLMYSFIIIIKYISVCLYLKI